MDPSNKDQLLQKIKATIGKQKRRAEYCVLVSPTALGDLTGIYEMGDSRSSHFTEPLRNSSSFRRGLVLDLGITNAMCRYWLTEQAVWLSGNTQQA